MSHELLPNENNPNPIPFIIKKEPIEPTSSIRPLFQDVINRLDDTSLLYSSEISNNNKRKRDDSLSESIIEKDFIISKLEDKIKKLEKDFVSEKRKNQKNTNELISLKFRIEKLNTKERNLVKVNKEYKQEIDLLNNHLTSFQNLETEFHQNLKALNQKYSKNNLNTINKKVKSKLLLKN